MVAFYCAWDFALGWGWSAAKGMAFVAVQLCRGGAPPPNSLLRRVSLPRPRPVPLIPPMGALRPPDLFCGGLASPAPRVTLSIAKESPEGSAGESPAAPKVTFTGLSPRVRLRLTPPARDLGGFCHLAPDWTWCPVATGDATEIRRRCAMTSWPSALINIRSCRIAAACLREPGWG